MIGGGREASQPGITSDPARQVEDLHRVLDRLRSRIEDVAAWAEHASFPGASDGGDGSDGAAESVAVDERSGPEASEKPAALDFLRGLARSGVVAGGVFSNGGDIIDLTESANAAQVPESGLVALLNLVPSDTVLEVRTSSTELRAARLGDDAFAVEVVPGSEREVDDWLSSLLPSREA
jgi:hypothetical protein